MSALLGHEMQGVWLNIILGMYIPLKSPFKSIDWAKQSTAFRLGKLHRIKDLHPSMWSLKETLISYSWAGARSKLRQLKVKHRISSCCWLNCNANWTPNLTLRDPLHQLKRFPFPMEVPSPLPLLNGIFLQCWALHAVGVSAMNFLGLRRAAVVQDKMNCSQYQLCYWSYYTQVFTGLKMKQNCDL